MSVINIPLKFDDLIEIIDGLSPEQKQVLRQHLDAEAIADVPESGGDESDAPPGSLAALIQAANKANLHSGYTDTSIRSREILDNEYPDYLEQKHGLDETPNPDPLVGMIGLLDEFTDATDLSSTIRETLRQYTHPKYGWTKRDRTD